MPTPIAQTDLESYLDEGLPIEEMARIERALRDDGALQKQLSAINARRDAGVHSLGEIWRRHRLSCPTREHLGSFLLGVLDKDLTDYMQVHLEVMGCRTCQANFNDLKSRQAEEPATSEARRKKYFQSSAGHLRRG